MIESRTTRSFRAVFAALPDEVQERGRRAYRLFRKDPAHPSLRFKKVEHTENVYSVRIGLGYRARGSWKARWSSGFGSARTRTMTV